MWPMYTCSPIPLHGRARQQPANTIWMLTLELAYFWWKAGSGIMRHGPPSSRRTKGLHPAHRSTSILTVGSRLLTFRTARRSYLSLSFSLWLILYRNTWWNKKTRINRPKSYNGRHICPNLQRFSFVRRQFISVLQPPPSAFLHYSRQYTEGGQRGGTGRD